MTRSPLPPSRSRSRRPLPGPGRAQPESSPAPVEYGPVRAVGRCAIFGRRGRPALPAEDGARRRGVGDEVLAAAGRQQGRPLAMGPSDPRHADHAVRSEWPIRIGGSGRARMIRSQWLAIARNEKGPPRRKALFGVSMSAPDQAASSNSSWLCTGPESWPLAETSRSTNSMIAIGAASLARMPALMTRV